MKCTSCGAALIFDPESGKMYCPYCRKYTDVHDFDGGFDGSLEAGGDTMEQNVYTCTSCGARVMVNDVESATYCIYCEQPTIVFDRVTDLRKPKGIVPFSITREQAHEILRQKLNMGRYVPKSIKNFDLDMIRGIYIPFRRYDVHYHARNLVKSTKAISGWSLLMGIWGSFIPNYRYSDGVVEFRDITVDASAAFNDVSAHKLEPYDLSKLQSFHTGYLMGFYGDCYDESNHSLDDKAIMRCKELYDDEILSKVTGKTEIANQAFYADILVSEYILLPVWFVVFHENDRHYTMMVNGQTSKVVGTVPFDRRKMKRDSFLLSLGYLSIPLLPLLLLVINTLMTTYGYMLLMTYLQLFAFTFLYVVIYLCFLIPKYWRLRKEFEDSLGLTQENAIRHLAADRQGKRK